MQRQREALTESQASCPGRWEQGFIDQFGDFLTRGEAMQIVKDNGQPFNIERNGGDAVLFSEGLY